MAIVITAPTDKFVDRNADTITVAWTNSNTTYNGNQASYEIQYRYPSSASWSTLGTVNSSTQSGNLKGIFTALQVDAKEIYYRICVKYNWINATGGYESGTDYSAVYSVVFHGTSKGTLKIYDGTAKQAYPLYDSVKGQSALKVRINSTTTAAAPLVATGDRQATKAKVRLDASTTKAIAGYGRYTASGQYANGYFYGYKNQYANTFLRANSYTRTYNTSYAHTSYGTRYYGYAGGTATYSHTDYSYIKYTYQDIAHPQIYNAYRAVAYTAQYYTWYFYQWYFAQSPQTYVTYTYRYLSGYSRYYYAVNGTRYKYTSYVASYYIAGYYNKFLTGTMYTRVAYYRARLAYRLAVDYYYRYTTSANRADYGTQNVYGYYTTYGVNGKDAYQGPYDYTRYYYARYYYHYYYTAYYHVWYYLSSRTYLVSYNPTVYGSYRYGYTVPATYSTYTDYYNVYYKRDTSYNYSYYRLN